MAEAVPQRQEEESKEKRQSDGETKRARSKAEEKRSQKRAERKQNEEKQQSQTRKLEVKEEDHPVIPYKKAKSAIKIIAAIQDEHKVVVSPGELLQFKNLLLEFGGLDQKVVNKMTDGEIVAEAQSVLRNAKAIKLDDKDFEYEQESMEGTETHLKVEKALAKKLIAKVQSTDEETLTADKAEHYLEVEEFAQATEKGGPGAMEGEEEPEAETAVQTLPLREIIAKLKILVRTGDNTPDNPQWITWTGRLQEAINEFNLSVQQRQFLNVYDFVTTIEEAIYTSEHYEPPLPDGRKAIEILETFLTSRPIENFKSKFEDLDKDFQTVYDRMDDKMRKIILEDLEIALGTQLQGILAGWNKPENVRAYVFGGIYTDSEGNVTRTRGIIDKVSRDYERSIGGEVVGLRAWRATKEIYGTEESVSIDLLTKPPARWQEVPERITNIYRFIERTDYTPEQLQENIGKAIRMIERVQTEDSEGRRILNELNEELKAFQAFHSFRVQLERATMNPDTLINVFQNLFDDETWVNFAKRFAHDSRLRKFMSENDQEYLNLLDEAVSIYFGQLEDERKRMNNVEEMTKRELHLDANTGDDEKIVIFEFVKKLSSRGNETLFGRINSVADLDNLSPSEKQQLMRIINRAWRYDVANMAEAIQSWLDTNTLLGAFGKDKDGADNLDKRRAELRERLKHVLVTRGLRLEKDERFLMLEQQLREKYTGQELESKIEELRQQRTQELIDELDKFGFLEAVDKNAYHLAWAFAWSDFDIIRIYGVNYKTKKLAQVPQQIAFAQHTKMFYSRHIDHFMDFIINEERGRGYEETEVNAIFRKKLLGEHGNLLPQNRTMVRFAKYFMTAEQLEEVERRTKEMMRKADFVPDESYRRALETESANDPNSGVRDPYFEGFIGWARSAAIAEMIDSGDTSFFSFSQARFSTIAHKLRQFEMIDLYSDRKAALAYFDRSQLQGYMRDPSNERFLQINDKDAVFYSGRNVRLWPWMNMAVKIHWEIANKHWRRLLDVDNMQSGAGESLVDLLVQNGAIKKEQGNYFKHELLGFAKGKFLGNVVFRRTRQYGEVARFAAWESKFLPFGVSIAMIWEFIKRLFGYTFAELGK